MTWPDIKQLFKEFAEQHEDILHTSNNQRFFIEYPDQIVNFQKAHGDNIFMILEFPDINLQDLRSDNLMENISFAFHICKAHTPHAGDENAMDNAIGECEVIAKQIVGRMIEMHAKWGQQNPKRIYHIHPGDINILPNDNRLYGTCVGIRVDGKFKSKDNNLRYDPNKWQIP